MRKHDSQRIRKKAWDMRFWAGIEYILLKNWTHSKIGKKNLQKRIFLPTTSLWYQSLHFPMTILVNRRPLREENLSTLLRCTIMTSHSAGHGNNVTV